MVTSMKIIKLLIVTTLIFIIPSCSHTHTFELSEVIEPIVHFYIDINTIQRLRQKWTLL